MMCRAVIAFLLAALLPLPVLAQSGPWHYVVLDSQAGVQYPVQELTNNTGVLFTNRFWDPVNGARTLTSGVGAEQFNGINNFGLAVGIRQGTDPADTRPACAYKDYRAIANPAQNLVQYGMVDAYSVNDAGDIVGVCELPCSSSPAPIVSCRISNGVRTDLSIDNSEQFASAVAIGAVAINRSGQIAANGSKILVLDPAPPVPITNVYPFLFDPGTGIHEIPFDPATTYLPSAVDINDSGVLLGVLNHRIADSPTTWHYERKSFVYSISGGYQELPIDNGPFPTDINSSGKIVGLWKNGVPFIYDQQNGPRDLMDVYPPAANGFAGWYYDFTGRIRINDRGEIVVGLVKGGSPSNPGGITDFRTVIIKSGAAEISSLPTPGTNTQVLYALWNGYLRMTNILELLNTGSSPMNVVVTAVSPTGKLGTPVGVPLAPSQQFDVIVSALDGFSADAYGLVRIEYQGSLEGRMFFYRPAPNNQDYEFAFGVPLAAPIQGTASVGFNTFQPSTDPADAAFPVQNWLSVVNLSTTVQSYTVNRFDQQGTFLTSSRITLNPTVRFDLDGGHTNPGPNRVGLNQIVPDDPFAPYLTQLMRYGAGKTDYRFAFSLAPGTPASSPIFAPISTAHSVQDWLEMINATDQPVIGTAYIYDQKGNLKGTFGKAFGPHEQYHLSMNGYLAAAETGYAAIVSDPNGAMIAQSMHYFRDASNGSILSMYGSQARHTSGDVLNGSYNLYLGMADELKVSNTRDDARTVNLNVFRPGGASTPQQFVLMPHETRILSIGDNAAYGTTPNTYGVVTLQSAAAGDLLSEMVRLRTSPTNQKLDFAAPTNVR